MPLTPVQFKLRVSPDTERWMRLAHSFLAAHPTLAYNESELLVELCGVEADQGVLTKALFELEYRCGVEARGEPGDVYYRYLDPIPEFDEA